MSGQAGAVEILEGVLSEESLDFDQERHSSIGEFGDLNDETNRIRLVKAMVMNKALPGFDLDGDRLERAVAKLPRSAVHNVVATMSKVFEANRKQSALLLESFQRRYVPDGSF